MTNPTAQAARRAAIYGLAREIGAQVWGPPDDLQFMAAWCRLLAANVARHTVPLFSLYGDKVIAWADEIMDAPTGGIIATCERIHEAILAVDYDDGWPADRAGYTLNAVCLGMTHALANNSRWPAEASQQVWRFVVGSGNYNEVVSISLAAWQQHLFAQAIVLAKQADELEREKADGTL